MAEPEGWKPTIRHRKARPYGEYWLNGIVGLAFALFLPVISYVLYWVVIIYYGLVSGIDVNSAGEAS